MKFYTKHFAFVVIFKYLQFKVFFLEEENTKYENEMKRKQVSFRRSPFLFSFLLLPCWALLIPPYHAPVSLVTIKLHLLSFFKHSKEYNPRKGPFFSANVFEDHLVSQLLGYLVAYAGCCQAPKFMTQRQGFMTILRIGMCENRNSSYITCIP